MKKIVIVLLILCANVSFGQRVKFTIKNDSISNKVLFKSLTDEVLKTVYVKGENFDANVDFEEGYYLLQKGRNELLLYLKRSDDLLIYFDAEDFYKTVVFTGEGAKRNTYLLNKKLDFLNEKGRISNYYKKDFYKGDENTYLDKLDKYYKNFFGGLFSNEFDKTFSDQEMKNLQYGYFLDLLKFEDAKKHYDFKDSVEISSSFLDPLNSLHFDKSEFAKRFHSYKELAILKCKKDVQNSQNYAMMQDVVSSIRTESIKQGVLKELYNEMSRKNQETKNYYNLIKTNTNNHSLLVKAKEKYSQIRRLEAEKNLSKLQFIDSHGIRTSLADFKGNYIFLTIWMSSCQSCLESLKDIEKLKKKYKNEEIVFVGISVDKQENFDKWATIIQDNEIGDKQLFFDGAKPKIVSEFNISSLPAYRLLSLKGKMLDDKIEDPLSKNTRKLISKLLNQEK